MILVNGIQQTYIDANDRGLAYGDGLFETIEINSAQPIYWKRHFNRLQAGCKVLGIICPDEKILLNEHTQLAKGINKGIVKIILTRGSAGRGYRPTHDSQICRILSLHPWPELPTHFYTEGIRLYSCETPVSVNSKLAGIKTLCRLEQVLAQSEWKEGDYAEGLMFDENKLLIEGTKTNIFIVMQGKLFTPLLNRAGIKGIMREIIIEAAIDLELPIIESDISLSDLQEADEIFVCNSIIKIWPVNKFMDKQYAIGEITRNLMSQIKEIN